MWVYFVYVDRSGLLSGFVGDSPVPGSGSFGYISGFVGDHSEAVGAGRVHSVNPLLHRRTLGGKSDPASVIVTPVYL